VDFILGDDFGFGDDGHVVRLVKHVCCGTLQFPCHPPSSRDKPRRQPASPFESDGAGPDMVEARNRRVPTDASGKTPWSPPGAQAKI
jgi:hypothetical protein